MERNGELEELIKYFMYEGFPPSQSEWIANFVIRDRMLMLIKELNTIRDIPGKNLYIFDRTRALIDNVTRLEG
jgi:hypothetical protein